MTHDSKSHKWTQHSLAHHANQEQYMMMGEGPVAEYHILT